LTEAWLRVLEKELAGSLSPAEIERFFKPQFCKAITLLRAVEHSSAAERYAAIESLIEFTGCDPPEIRDVVVAAVRRGIRDSSGAAREKGAEPAAIQQVAVRALLDFERRLAAIGDE
jgi:hypothetical protein